MFTVYSFLNDVIQLVLKVACLGLYIECKKVMKFILQRVPCILYKCIVYNILCIKLDVFYVLNVYVNVYVYCIM